MKKKLIQSSLAAVLIFAASSLFELVHSPLAGIATARQLNDGISDYAAATVLQNSSWIFWLAFGLFLIPIWRKQTQKDKKIKMKKTNLVIAFASMLMLTQCGDPKVLDVKEIKPNETVWVIPLDAESKSGQAKFNSVDYLNQRKVAAKRIMIDKVSRSTGRMWWDYEWIPAVRVITVDRSLVTREWTDNESTGTSKGHQGIPVNTKDNIALTVGLTITTNIEEEDSSTYLYYHGEKPLDKVTDENIRSYAVAELNRKVSGMLLTEFQANQNQIYVDLFTDAAKAFKEKGVTIQYLGNAEGWHFADKSIQESINKSYIAEQDNITAQKEQAATRTRNETLVQTAQATADAAKKLFDAREASEFQNQLEIKKMGAQASLKMAEKWSGALPTNILPSNSPLLLGLGDKKE